MHPREQSRISPPHGPSQSIRERLRRVRLIRLHDQRGEPKVAQLSAEVRVDQDVCAREVAVDDRAEMKIRQALRDFCYLL